jgi:hypothetical protein
LAVKENFADSPRHLDVGWARHSNQYGHARHLI